jgi:hypothetical protein
MNPIMGRRAEGLPATSHRPGCDSEWFQFFCEFSARFAAREAS